MKYKEIDSMFSNEKKENQRNCADIKGNVRNYCPFCGREKQREWDFCPSCGNNLINSDVVSESDYTKQSCVKCSYFRDEPKQPIVCTSRNYCPNKEELKRLQDEKREKSIRREHDKRWRDDEPKRSEFIKQMSAFLAKHGTEEANAEALLWYAVQKLNSGFNFHGVKWSADSDCIQYRMEWGAFSFFDDGGGEEGYHDWSITFVGNDTGDYLIDNDKLKNLQPYDVACNSSTSDLFYCQNPFGLNGIYRVQFDGQHKFFD